jgi:hypothetical protein
MAAKTFERIFDQLTPEIEDVIIEFYKENPFLWALNHPEYKDRAKKTSKANRLVVEITHIFGRICRECMASLYL